MTGPGKDTEAEAIAAWNTRTPRPDNALADDAVEHVLAHVAGGGPHEWGYRDPVTGEFIADDWPFRAADALAAVRSTAPEADLRAEIEALREVVRRLGRAALTTPSCKTCCQIEQDARAALTKGADHD
jgi:hypothetical protein